MCRSVEEIHCAVEQRFTVESDFTVLSFNLSPPCHPLPPSSINVRIYFSVLTLRGVLLTVSKSPQLLTPQDQPEVEVIVTNYCQLLSHWFILMGVSTEATRWASSKLCLNRYSSVQHLRFLEIPILLWKILGIT